MVGIPSKGWLVAPQRACVEALHVCGRLSPAPQAQWLLTPRFSVGQRLPESRRDCAHASTAAPAKPEARGSAIAISVSPIGTEQLEKCNRMVAHFSGDGHRRDVSSRLVWQARSAANPDHACEAPLKLFQLCKRFSHPLPGCAQIFRKHPRLRHRRHEVGIANPPRHRMHVQMSGNARSRRLAQVQSEIEPMRPVKLLQRALRQLREDHQFVRRIGVEFGDAIEVRVGHHHHVPRRVRVRIEADETGFTAPDQPSRFLSIVGIHSVLNGVIDAGNQVAEDAVQVPRPRVQARGHTGPRRSIRRRYICKSPRTPELIHIQASPRTLSPC